MQDHVLGLAALAVLGAANHAQVSVFSTNFDSGAPAQFSGVTTTTSVQGYAGIGASSTFGGSFLRNTTGCPTALAPTTLSLVGLPAHGSVQLKFLLAIIDTWDGLAAPFGPDYLDVSVDGALVFSASFKNSFGGGHPYVPPAGVLLSEGTQLGFRATGTNDQDSAFDMAQEPMFQTIPHSSATLTVTWTARGTGWQHNCTGGDLDESWAIENVEVVLWPCATSAVASETVRLGTPPNPSALVPGLTTRPILGQTWDPAIDHTSFAPGAFLDFVAVDLGPPINVSLSFGTLLCTPPPPSQVFFAVPGNAFAVPVPSGCQFVGQAAVAQGGSVSAGPRIQLANALDLVIGTM